MGINLAGPTLLAHGTPEQCRRWLPAIVSAEEIWCQLFSEPGAGSDLSGLDHGGPRRVDGGWRVTGQKVWTSYAQFARYGLCLARSEPGTSGPRGLSLLVVDMEAPGVDIRPLVQITGEAEFNEVFLDDVFVPADHLVGPAGQGWAVASTTLAHERGTNFPFKEEVVHEGYLSRLFARPRPTARFDDPDVADALVDAYVSLVVLRTHNWRTLSQLAARRRAGARVELGQAHVVGHDPAAVARRRWPSMGADGRPVGAVATAVAVVEGGQHRRRHVGGPAQRDRGAHSRASPRAEEVACPSTTSSVTTTWCGSPSTASQP